MLLSISVPASRSPARLGLVRDLLKRLGDVATTAIGPDELSGVIYGIDPVEVPMLQLGC